MNKVLDIVGLEKEYRMEFVLDVGRKGQCMVELCEGTEEAPPYEVEDV